MRPNLALDRPNSAKVGPQNRPKLASTSTDVGPKFSQSWPGIGQNGPRTVQNWPDFGQLWLDVGIRPDFDHI